MKDLEAQIKATAERVYGTSLTKGSTGLVASHIRSNYQEREITSLVIEQNLEGLLDLGWVELVVVNPNNFALWQLRDQILFGDSREQQQRKFSLSLADYRRLHYQKIIRESDLDFKTSHSKHLALVNQLLELEPRLQFSFEGYCDLVLVNKKFILTETGYLDKFRTYITKLIVEYQPQIPAEVWAKLLDFPLELVDVAEGLQVDSQVNRVEFSWE